MVSVSMSGKNSRIAASAAVGLSVLFATGTTLCADDDRDNENVTAEHTLPTPIDSNAWAYPDPKLRRFADRIVNGRTNLELIGDSILYTDMSAAYVATFRPKYGMRGYSSTGLMFSINAWSAYTNAYAGWTTEGLALGKNAAAIETLFFTLTDQGSPWISFSGPTNIRRMSALEDLPDTTNVARIGSANFYEGIWSDDSFLTEEGARLRYRVLWYDHPQSMPFSVQGESTIPAYLGGSTQLHEVPVAQTAGVTMRFMEIPEVVELGGAVRDLSRRTGIAVHTATGHVEEPGETMILGAARVWNDAREKGIQWGWLTAGGARANAFRVVPPESWQTYIEYAQSDTFLMQVGVNDLINEEATGAEAAVIIGETVDMIYEAHQAAQKNDPSIQDALFMLVSPCDCWNPTDEGSLTDNREWVDLAEGLRAFAKTRDDTVYIDLRGMVEEIEGAWLTWRYIHTRDGIHPKGPYWHENGELWWECHPFPDGAMFFADLVWQKLREAAPGLNPENPADLCNCDIDFDCEVGGSDLAEVLAFWGDAVEGQRADIDGDGRVDGLDLSILLGAWGPCP